MRLAIVAALSCLTGTVAAVDIPAQSLDSALQSLAKEKGIQVVYTPDVVQSLKTQGATGELTPDEALKKLLSGTGLTYRYLDKSTITVFPTTNEVKTSDTGAGVVRGPIHLAQADAPQAAAASTQSEGKEEGSDKEDHPDSQKKQDEQMPVEEVVVTGSHIRGAGPGASPVIVFDREEIERRG